MNSRLLSALAIVNLLPGTSVAQSGNFNLLWDQGPAGLERSVDRLVSSQIPQVVDGLNALQLLDSDVKIQIADTCQPEVLSEWDYRSQVCAPVLGYDSSNRMVILSYQFADDILSRSVVGSDDLPVSIEAVLEFFLAHEVGHALVHVGGFESAIGSDADEELFADQLAFMVLSDLYQTIDHLLGVSQYFVVSQIHCNQPQNKCEASPHQPSQERALNIICWGIADKRTDDPTTVGYLREYGRSPEGCPAELDQMQQRMDRMLESLRGRR